MKKYTFFIGQRVTWQAGSHRYYLIKAANTDTLGKYYILTTPEGVTVMSRVSETDLHAFN